MAGKVACAAEEAAVVSGINDEQVDFVA